MCSKLFVKSQTSDADGENYCEIKIKEKKHVKAPFKVSVYASVKCVQINIEDCSSIFLILRAQKVKFKFQKKEIDSITWDPLLELILTPRFTSLTAAELAEQTAGTASAEARRVKEIYRYTEDIKDKTNEMFKKGFYL